MLMMTLNGRIKRQGFEPKLGLFEAEKKGVGAFNRTFTAHQVHTNTLQHRNKHIFQEHRKIK